ncbi:MAG: PAS domain-containing protein [Desulfobacterales bacterium]|nr:PAS domain-containing protein [Desulfobacterales bacterium]
MKKNRTGQENFDLLRLEDDLVPPIFMLPPDGRSSLHKLIQNFQAIKIELEMQNKELLRSRQELMKSNICFAELYDTAPVGYITLDLKGLILNVNLTLADMLSVGRPTLLNQPFTDHVVVEDRGVYHRYLQDMKVLRTKQVCELRLQKKDGAFLDVQLESILTTDRGKNFEQIRTVVIEMGERKRAEKEKIQAKLLQAHKMEPVKTVAGGIVHDFNNIPLILVGNAEKLMLAGRLAASFAHSVRNSLTAIKMRLYSLQKDEFLPDKKDDLKVIIEGMGNIEDLSKNFLEFSGPIKVRKTKVSPSAVVDKVIQLLGPELEERNVQLQLNRSHFLSETWIDVEQLKEAIVNLVINGSEAAGNGKRYVSIYEKEVNQAPSGRSAVIEIHDNGGGVSLN